VQLNSPSVLRTPIVLNALQQNLVGQVRDNFVNDDGCALLLQLPVQLKDMEVVGELREPPVFPLRGIV
jgi:hypothetical protein